MSDSTLFKGTAQLYAKYRPQYPKRIFDLIKKYSQRKKNLKVLDLGCGPGTLTLPLNSRVELKAIAKKS